MERIELIKRSGNTVWWSIDVTTMPLEKVIELIISEKGDDYQIKRTPDRVLNECLHNIKTKAIKGGK